MNKIILVTGAILGILSVIIGAFAAHGLNPLITSEAIQSFETGVRYQMYHALLLLFIGSSNLISTKSKKLSFYLICIGVLFFSGSIYALATNALTSFDFKAIGFVTPIGGMLLISGWVILLINFLQNSIDN